MVGRYAIYEMLDKTVVVTGMGRKPFKGVVKDVVRDIYIDEIVVTVGRRTIRVKEPDRCVKDSGGVRLEYGVVTKSFQDAEQEDGELFQAMRDRAYAGDTIDEIMADTVSVRKTIKFEFAVEKKK